MISITSVIICGIAALAGGCIDAVAGGGGLLTLPALLICGVPPHVALGTNKVSACFGTAVALFNYSRNHLVSWHMAASGIMFSLVGSWVSTLLALHLNSDILGKIIVMLLPIGVAATLLPGRKNATAHIPEKGLKYWLLLPSICFVLGVYDGFFGPATGSFLILALHWILGLGLIQASATAKTFNLGSNVSGAASFILHGTIIWPLALVMAACFMTGNWIGSKIAIRVGAKAVRVFLFFSLLLLMVSLVWRYFIAG